MKASEIARGFAAVQQERVEKLTSVEPQQIARAKSHSFTREVFARLGIVGVLGAIAISNGLLRTTQKR